LYNYDGSLGILYGGGTFLKYTPNVGIKAEEPLVESHSSISNIHISPNPTEATSTLTLELQTAGVLTITLNDLLGAELFELHNAFTDAGTFTKTFSIEALPQGVYYLKIKHNGTTKIEKVIRY